MEIRNAISRHPENLVIDCEVNHPEFGWIPFTWSADDRHGIAAAVGKAIKAEGVEVAAFIPEPEPDQALIERSEAIRSAREYLASTDWYVVRRSETGEPIPQDVMDKRAAARAAANV